MPTFHYEARDSQGQLVNDLIEAANLREAVRTLQQEMRYVVISIREARKCSCGRPGPAPGKSCEGCGKVASDPAAGLFKFALLAGLAGIVGRLLGII